MSVIDMEWQPIETAPKDGTPIRLAQFNPWGWPHPCSRKGKPERSCVGAYVRIKWMRAPEFNRMVKYKSGTRFYQLGDFFLSHWMPLTEPPKDAAP